MSTLKVDAIRHNSATSDAITTAANGTCTANITNNLSNRRINVNGALNVAQRYTSGTTTPVFMADRYKAAFGSINVTVTGSQQSLTSSDTPYSLGFRKFGRIALASAATAGANDFVEVLHKFEGQDINSSGWDHTSSSSNITISFWFRCSTNQTFYADLRSRDGTSYVYSFSFTASGNNTWTKITKTIPGNSNVQIDNDNGNGLDFRIRVYFGSDYTDNVTLDQWRTHSNSTQTQNMASTWLEAGASTFDVTGFQFEAGSVATDFEHLSYGDELQRCRRYYQVLVDQAGGSSQKSFAIACAYTSGSMHSTHLLSPEMRAVPTLDYTTGTDYYRAFSNGSADPFNDFTLVGNSHPHAVDLAVFNNLSVTAGSAVLVRTYNSAARVAFTSEL